MGTCRRGLPWLLNTPTTGLSMLRVTLIVAAVTILSASCSGASYRGPEQGGPTAAISPTDTAHFAAVVRALSEQTQREKSRLKVDPRPLRADPEIMTLNRHVLEVAPLDPVNQNPLAPAHGEILRRRVQVLNRLGAEQTDAFAGPRCPGVLVPPEMADRSGCPKERMRLAILGLPRPGGAYRHRQQSAEAQEEERAKGLWAVRVLSHALYPEGSNWVAADYVIQRDPSTRAWRVVDVVMLFIAE